MSTADFALHGNGYGNDDGNGNDNDNGKRDNADRPISVSASPRLVVTLKITSVATTQQEQEQKHNDRETVLLSEQVTFPSRDVVPASSIHHTEIAVMLGAAVEGTDQDMRETKDNEADVQCAPVGDPPTAFSSATPRTADVAQVQALLVQQQARLDQQDQRILVLEHDRAHQEPSPSPPQQQSLPEMALPPPEPIRERWLFLGNPGVGKSSLVNCLVGKPVFGAGLSYGSGKTVALQQYQQDGILYMDTPGLADTALRSEAARAITSALRQADQGGLYKLIFILTLRQGRAHPPDLMTIRHVLDAIDQDPRSLAFTVIVNMVQRKQLRDLETPGSEAIQRLMQSLTVDKYAPRPEHVLFLRERAELNEEDNAVVELPEVLRFLAEDAPSVSILSAQIKEIEVDAARFAAEVERLENMLSILGQQCRSQPG